MNGPYRLFVSALSLLLIACGANQPKTLASLSEEPVEIVDDSKVEINTLTHQQVRDEYEALLDVFEEEKLKEKIERRIADVYMMEGVYEQNQQLNKDSYYSEATEAYLDILEKYPDSPDNAEILYQLSKAYDIEGNQDAALETLTRLTRDYPSYSNITEAWFRKGDIHFNYGEYSQAQTAYAAVVESNEQSYQLNAHYMLGWSQYKQFNFREGIDSFSLVVNRLLGRHREIAQLEDRQRALVEESINSISLSLDKVGGAKEIESFENLAAKNYVWLIYDDLGEYYLNKERYEDGAEAYRLFVDNYSNSVKAPSMHDNIINAYDVGGFIRQTRLEKENYVTAYGLTSTYTKNRGGISPEVSRSLAVYLEELAGYYHSLAQTEREQFNREQEKEQRFRDTEQEQKLAIAAVNAYDKAADYYGQFATTFPNKEDVDKIYFLRAETLFSAYRYPEAAIDYERVAYNSIGISAQEHLNDAGYAAIIAYQNHLNELTSGSNFPGRDPQPALVENDPRIARWQERSSISMLRFVDIFYQDNRSTSVLSNAADYLFESKQYSRAVKFTTALINDHSDLQQALKKTAYGVMALSYFRLEDYQNAENSYFSQRQLVETETEEYTKISERLGLSIYKKSENLIANGEELAAIEELLKIKTLTPLATTRVPAQYDAASLLLKQENWSAAIIELEELDADFSNHNLAVEFPRKLAFAYEKNTDWELAATTYTRLANDDPETEVRQEALFVSGFMYEKSGDYDTSNQKLIRYTRTYQQPFDNYMEASYQLALNYEQLNNQEKQNQWLDEIVRADSVGDTQRTERSRWLAAWASSEHANFYARQFKASTLSQPIAETVGAKNALLQEASSRFERAASYGFFEFITMSSYKIGDLYQTFAHDLRAVEPPASLSTEDQSVYRTILNEQAEPFDELSRELHQNNIDKGWNGQFNEWIANSFTAMQSLSPERYGKNELIVSYGDGIY